MITVQKSHDRDKTTDEKIKSDQIASPTTTTKAPRTHHRAQTRTETVATEVKYPHHGHRQYAQH